MADPNDLLQRLDAELAKRGGSTQGPSASDVLAKIEAALGVGQGYQGPMRAPDSTLAVAPGTTPEEASRIPRGMVYDPRTGGYVDTALMADRYTQSNPMAPALGNVAAGYLGVGEYFDEGVGQLGRLSGMSPEIGAEFTREVQDRQGAGGEFASRLAGGALSIAGLVGAARAVPGVVGWVGSKIPQAATGRVLGGAVTGAVVGGAEGAVSGYGAGNDGNRMASAGRGAGFGVLAGGVAGAAAPLLGDAAGWVYRSLKDNFGRVSARIPGLSPQASQLVKEAADADTIGGGALRNVRRAGDDAMPADFGPATQDLLDTAVSMSSAGRKVAGEAVEARAARAMPRLNRTFDSVMGGPKGMLALRSAVDDAARPGIKSAYRDAYATVIDYSTPEGRRLENIVAKIPERIFNQAASKARERMQWEGIPSQFLVQMGKGKPRVTKIPSVIELDYLKRSLDDIISDGTDPLTRKMNSDAQLASQMKTALRDGLRQAVPAYGRALEEASDAFSLNNAIELGSNLLQKGTTREQVAMWAKTATPIEKRALASGLRSNIDETIANVTKAITTGEIEVAQARQILRDMSSEAARAKMLTVLGPRDARSVFKALNEATQSLSVKASVAANSRTAPRTRRDQLVRDAQAYSPDQIARDAASGGILAAPRKVAAIAANNTPLAQNARTEQLYLEIAEYLTGKKGPDAVAAAQQMMGALNAAPVQAARTQAISRGVAGATASGYPVATQYQRTGPR
jgi:hypothetical protein